MIKLIERTIEAEARKRIARYSKSEYYINKYRTQFKKRTGKRPTVFVKGMSDQWSFHPHFDPRYCINHSKFIARGIWASLRAGHYVPIKSYRIGIPKASGGMRNIDAFSVPDAAIAKIFLNNIRTRNAKIFSDSSYAYQLNKTNLDAVIRLKSLIETDTIYISQYDFSSFFDAISHDYIDDILARNGPFLTTTMERYVLGAVIKHQYETKAGLAGTRTVGVPQGNSLSMFLSNAAAHPLDEELARLNGSFARFADDSVVVNYKYEDALRCAEAFQRFSNLSGVQINKTKSTGIRMVSDKPCEMASVSEFTFLSYAFRTGGLFVSSKSINAIKRRCIKIIYNHLLLHPRRTKTYSIRRVGKDFRDWDLVTCINELRSYIYGGRSQSEIDAHIAGTINIGRIRGPASYFCLVEESAQFRSLDGWLINILERAYNARVVLLNGIAAKKRLTKMPCRRIKSGSIVDGSWYKGPIPLNMHAPSFHLAWRAARKSWAKHGLGGVDAVGEEYAYS